MTAAFAATRKSAEKRLTDGKPAEDDAQAASDLIQIPGAYYSGDTAKRKAVNMLLQQHDIAWLDSLAQTRAYAEMWKQGEALRQMYADLGWEAPWMQPKLEKLAIGTLSALEKQSLEKFFEAVKQLKAYPAWAGSGSKVESYIDSVVEDKLKRAAALAAGGKFEEASSLYLALGTYRDTSKELQAMEAQALTRDPKRSLAKAGAQGRLTAATPLKAKDGSVQAAALSDEGPKSLLARLLPDGSVRRLEAPVDAGLKPVSIRYADMYGSGSEPAAAR
ncbi:hypothetical protein LJK87_17785 [Paenibacillus sp. P25]|nr:hypothetical protein LJK87_17785 [Paenibacillus sp. P25]